MGKQKIGIVTVPISRSGTTPLSHLIEIICSISKKTILITGNDGYEYFKSDERIHSIGISHKDYTSHIQRIVHFMAIQMTITFWILKKRHDIDILIFFMGGDTLVLPLLIASLLRKKSLLLFAGSSINTLEIQRDPLKIGLEVLHLITCTFAKKIILYSTSLIEEYHLKRWKEKILIAHEHYLDLNRFNTTIPLSARPATIGYIGRLSPEKGICNFIKALPAILSEYQDLHVFIGGDGPLKESLERFPQVEKFKNRIDFHGWIFREDLPQYLNQLRLLVLPSYTEGLPNIMLEAMACGTPVLATPVGAIPDIIIEGETGFIMEKNSPKCIAENVTRALNSPDMERIAERGRRFVEENYTFENAVNIWAQLFEEI